MPKRKIPVKKEIAPEKPKVNPLLEGFEINIDAFGEVKSTFDIDRLNAFLNDNVKDKKLDNRQDFDE
jgi:hypothetical protein